MHVCACVCGRGYGCVRVCASVRDRKFYVRMLCMLRGTGDFIFIHLCRYEHLLLYGKVHVHI